MARPTTYIFVTYAAFMGCSGLLSSAALGEQLVLGDELLGSPRVRGLGGAGIAGDDGYTAAAVNPAFIGVGKGASDSIFAVKQLTFPHLQVSADAVTFSDNQNIAATNPDELKLQKLAAGPLRHGTFDATALPSIVIGRTFVGYLMHHEAIVAARSDFAPEERDERTLALRYRSHHGPMVGIAHGTSALQMGIMAAYLEQTFIDGDFSYNELDTPKARKQALGPVTREAQGLYTLVGLSYQLYRPWALELAATAHNPGGSTFKGEEGEGEEAQGYIQPPLYQAALAVKPKLSSWLTMAAAVQLNHSAGKVSTDGLSGGVEWLLGKDRNGKKDFAIRLGYNKVGLGFGVKANLGLIGISFAQDTRSLRTEQLSAYQRPAAEPQNAADSDWAASGTAIQRRSVSLSINVADF